MTPRRVSTHSHPRLPPTGPAQPLPLSTADKGGIGFLVVSIVFLVISIVLFVVVYLPEPPPLPTPPGTPVISTRIGTLPGLDDYVEIDLPGGGINEKYAGRYTVETYSSTHDDPSVESDARRNSYFQPPDLTINPQAIVWQARYAPGATTYPVLYWRYNGNPVNSRMDMLVYIQGTSLSLGVTDQYMFIYNLFINVGVGNWPMRQIPQSFIWAYILPNLNSLDASHHLKVTSVVTEAVDQPGRLGQEERITSGVMDGGAAFNVTWLRPVTRAETREITRPAT